MQALPNGGLQLPDVATITCHVPPPAAPLICEPWERRQHPANGYDGKWGLAYCLAAQLVDGRVDVATFASAPDPEIVEVARRITWRPMMDHRFPERFEALVEIGLTDGTARSRRIDSVRGAPDRPIQQADVEAKFRANAARALPPPSVERLAEAILSLERMETPAPMTRILRQTEG